MASGHMTRTRRPHTWLRQRIAADVSAIAAEPEIRQRLETAGSLRKLPRRLNTPPRSMISATVGRHSLELMACAQNDCTKRNCTSRSTSCRESRELWTLGEVPRSLDLRRPLTPSSLL